MKPTLFLINKNLLIFIMLFSELLTSCTVVSFSSKNGNLMYSKNIRDYEVVGKFFTKTKEVEIIWGLLDLSDPSKEVGEFIEKEITKYNGDAVNNLEFKYQVSLSDYIISLFTYNVVATRNVIIKGDVIKYKNSSF